MKTASGRKIRNESEKSRRGIQMDNEKRVVERNERIQFDFSLTFFWRIFFSFLCDPILSFFEQKRKEMEK